MSIRALSPELAKKAKDELFEDPARIPQDLQNIKDWLAKQPHITARTDDQWLIAFLRGCKYSLERTKEKLDLFYTMKTMNPEMTVPVDPMSEAMQMILKSGSTLPLKRTEKPDDPRIIIMRPGIVNMEKFPMSAMMSVGIMYAYMHMLEDDQSVIAGQVIVVDMTDLNMAFMTQVMTPALMKKMIVTQQDALPIRNKGSHHVNSPAAFLKIFNFFRMFMNEKMKSRMYFHSDMEAFHKLIPKSILPTEYGGDGGPVQDIIDEWKLKFENHRDWFLEEAKYKTDESKRPGAPKTADALFGIEGSFRKLDFD